MRKVLFIILIVILVIFTGIVIYSGLELGKLNIWGVTQIQDENEQIDTLNSRLGELVNNTYPQALGKLNSSTETLQAAKKEYEDQAILVKNSKYYRETEKYKLEFLWTRIGNYAKDRKIDVTMSISNGSAAEFYNINVTAAGLYANVADFIYDIENDSRLGFKIEDFSMTSGSTTINSEGEKVTTSNGVVGKFTCKEIQIDLKSLDDTSRTQNVDGVDPNMQSTRSTIKDTLTQTNTQNNDDTMINENSGTIVDNGQDSTPTPGTTSGQ